jgi:hypothetical protein
MIIILSPHYIHAGFPFRMRPNYEDSSCVFEFGVSPPLLPEDEAIEGPCPSGCKTACSSVPMVPIPQPSLFACSAEADSSGDGVGDNEKREAFLVGVDGIVQVE